MTLYVSCGISGLTISWGETARAVLIAKVRGEPKPDPGLYTEWVPVVPALRVQVGEFGKSQVLHPDKPVLRSWRSWAKNRKVKVPFHRYTIQDPETSIPGPDGQEGPKLRMAYIADAVWDSLQAENRRRDSYNYLPAFHQTSASTEEDLLEHVRLRRETYKPGKRGEKAFDALISSEEKTEFQRQLIRGGKVQDVLWRAVCKLTHGEPSEEVMLLLRGGIDLKRLDTLRDCLSWRLRPSTLVSDSSDNRTARRVLRDIIQRSELSDRKRYEADHVDAWDEEGSFWTPKP